jgi:hypothetical protein
VILRVILMIALAACASAPAPAKRGDVTAIENVTVFDGIADRAQPAMTVVMRDGVIVAVGPAAGTAIPAGATIVDGRGSFLVPGLWNMHVHGVSYAAARAALPGLLAHGITGLRDMGMPLDDAIRLKHDAGAPHVFVAGPLVQGPLPFDNPLMLQVKQAGDADAVVRTLKQAGTDFVKIHDAIPEDGYLAVAAAARRERIPLVGHIPPTITAAQAIEAGQRSIEHLGGQFLGVLIAASANEPALHAKTVQFYRDAVARLASGQEPQSPQFHAEFLRAVLDGYRSDRAQQLFARFARAGVYHCPTLSALERLTADHAGELSDAEKELNAAVFRRNLEVVRAMHAAGVKLLAGTDTPYPAAGDALYDELALLVRAGLSPTDALRTATSGATEFLGIANSVGTIAIGKRADVVLLAADPLRDIANVRRVKAVFFAGRRL